MDDPTIPPPPSTEEISTGEPPMYPVTPPVASKMSAEKTLLSTNQIEVEYYDLTHSKKYENEKLQVINEFLTRLLYGKSLSLEERLKVINQREYHDMIAILLSIVIENHYYNYIFLTPVNSLKPIALQPIIDDIFGLIGTYGINRDEINTKLIDLLTGRNKRLIDITNEIFGSSITGEIVESIDIRNPKCQTTDCRCYVFFAYLNKVPIGIVSLFVPGKSYIMIDPTEGYQKYLMIQTMTARIPYILAKFGWPELNLPRLNDLFIPKIKKYARSIGVKYILVNPVSKQRDILTQYYNFQEIPLSITQYMTNENISIVTLLNICGSQFMPMYYSQV